MKIAVVGSGFAGMSAASYLAKEGFEVTVFEKNEGPGGRARLWEQDGFSFDMGPSWYWMPEVFEQFYADFGFKTEDFYELKRLDPSYRVFFDSEALDVPAFMTPLLELFEQREPGSAAKLKVFLNNAEYKYNTALKDYVNRPSHNIMEFMEWHLLVKAIKMRLFRSVKKEVNEVVKDPKLSSILEFPVLFLGATPEKTPALYTMMNHADLSLGTWYPMKGMHEISKAFCKVATSVGVQFKFNEEVKAVTMKGDSIEHLITSAGNYAFDQVVAACDYHFFEQKLLPKSARVYTPEYWDNRVMSPSSLLFYLGVNKKIPGLLHHNLFFDQDFDRHAHEIYTEPSWPTSPLFYTCAPSVTDPSVAPQGSENLFLLMPLAPGLEDSEAMRQKYFDIMLQRLESKTQTNIREHITVNRSYCLNDFETDYHSFKGNAYGLANTLKQTAFLKPALKSKKVPNLWYTGQLTVPGPGVPPTIISGRIVAEEIYKNVKKNPV